MGQNRKANTSRPRHQHKGILADAKLGQVDATLKAEAIMGQRKASPGSSSGVMAITGQGRCCKAAGKYRGHLAMATLKLARMASEMFSSLLN